MPVVRSRQLRTAVWIGLVVLFLPLGITLTELPSGDTRAWWRLGALLFVGATLAIVLVRQVSFDKRLKEQAGTEAALRASEAKFSGILGIAADAIISVDQERRIVHFNRGAEEIFGYKTADAIGRHLNILIPARYRSGHDAHMEAFARSPTTARRMGERREIFGLRSDGTEFPAEASISKLILPDGILFTVVLRDITDRRRAEEDERFLVAASTELAQSLDFDAATQMVADVPVPRLADAAILDVIMPGDTLRRVISTRQRAQLTPALYALADRPLTWDSPSPVIDAIRRKRREVVLAVDDDWLDASEDPANIPHWRALGARSLLIVPLVAGDEAFGALTLIATDPAREFSADVRLLADKFAATAARTLENARLYGLAQRATRARDEVLGIVSHDLRNPMSAIAMCARVLQENPPNDAGERNQLLATIRESTEWVNRLIQDLLDVANIERGRLSLELRSQDPAQIALQARHMFEVEATQHGITLDVNVPTNLPLLTADGARIVQALGNLLRNAIKFTPNGGRIVLGVERAESGVVFSVRDSGTGIPLANQERVFDRYWQSSDGSRARGTGLGLSITKGIVEAHGGTIWVQSTPGQGSTFSFSVPDYSSAE
ncbi:MAG TPA: ATP-binding protein [Gemmatimonadaceae bacterium]